jgi:hypothetical protein
MHKKERMEIFSCRKKSELEGVLKTSKKITSANKRVVENLMEHKDHCYNTSDLNTQKLTSINHLSS